jgi:hypothetical protein
VDRSICGKWYDFSCKLYHAVDRFVLASYPMGFKVSRHVVD